jgi:hypothetical protein
MHTSNHVSVFTITIEAVRQDLEMNRRDFYFSIVVRTKTKRVCDCLQRAVLGVFGQFMLFIFFVV